MVGFAAMRDVSSLDPMWDPETPPKVRGGGVVRLFGRVGKAVAPHLLKWAAGMQPQLRVAWGATEYRLTREGIASVRRQGPGFEDNPRSNYNDRLRKRQEKAAANATAPEAAPPSKPDPAPEVVDTAPEVVDTAPEVVDAPAEASPSPADKPKVTIDLSEAALRKAVDETMGRDADGDAIKDPDALKSALAQVRASLQALDDVKDWGTVETLDDELYKLHKAVEYKMRNHKASEAKSKLDDLFK